MRITSLAAFMLIVSQTGLFGATSYTLPNGNTSSFTILYDGIQTAASASVTFTPSNWTYAAGVTSFDLLMAVSNTTAANLGGRLTGMGFTSTPDFDSDANFNVAIVDLLNAGNGVLDEVFKQVDDGTGASLPQVGLVDFCVWAKASGGNCNGAGSGTLGILYGTTESSQIRISYSGAGTFKFDNFYARFQALTGNPSSDVGEAPGDGCTGPGCFDDTVPEPGFYGLLATGLSGLLFATYRLRRRADG